ncbi:MAG: hypothetical protein UV74_C0013G0461 [Candidatus Woesebacteria bacterium GW2011_GWB1_43_14]|uniref:Uncharacterized protein n=1 Tax=Candidatus Woesebacteria bacterium GW2011_GWB1_43_14 TaxID=1618578 RepID=A0A0G1DI38_9BACT|nr:MAG: hypothetical protein UT21_C0001G0173 [Candidatus Woesebacteria bacterium GW2011_GWA1_39_11b]KKS78081.1 MAG: hypothetical protein UV51_C0003G0116 [Candidatus Woesebacteria bacterium GW2011_GWC1_42_9]KKS97339.1 MAG: hypothetical protein UV74_C0013G0461 [Candidatus Woesebacteria bacterium GW2011_GWB1_43_14]
MIRISWETFKFVFENAPNIGFWAGVLIIPYNWYIHQHIVIKMAFIIVPVSAIVLFSLKTFKKMKNIFWEIKVESGLKGEQGKRKGNPTKRLARNLPSKNDLAVIYKFAFNYARTWASDGMLEEINYYVKLAGDKITKSAQIYIQSQLRREILALYLPRRYQKVEEFDEYGRSSKINTPKIYSFTNWRKAIEKALENSTRDIEKSDETRLQISPSTNSLNINLTFSKKNRDWRNRYTLKENELKCGGKVIAKLE